VIRSALFKVCTYPHRTRQGALEYILAPFDFSIIMARKTRKEVVKEEVKEEVKDADATEQQPSGNGAKIPRKKKRRLSPSRDSIESAEDVKVADNVNAGAEDVKVADDVEVQSSKKSSKKNPRRTSKTIDPPADDKVVEVEGEDMKRIKKSEKAATKRKEKLLEGAREDAKADFAATRTEVLARVPEAYKKMFGQVGFAKWGKAVLPALIVSPYDVPMGEGEPREIWLGMLNNVSY
jgi:hypothetical protein